MLLAIFGSICFILAVLVAYNEGRTRGIGSALDFFVDNLEGQGYTVELKEDIIEVIPKYQKEWYLQRSRGEELKGDN